MKGCFQQNGSEALTLGRNLNSFLGSVILLPTLSPLHWNFCIEKFLCVLFIWKLTWRVTVVRLSRVVWHWSWKGRMCLEKWHWSYAVAVAYRSRCELKHLSVPEGPRWLDLYTYCTGLYVGQPCPSVLCSRDDFRPNVCLTVWPNMCKIFASLSHDTIGVINCCLLCGAWLC